MRKVLASTFVSLDGVMQAPGGPDEDRSGGFAHGGWIIPFGDESIGAAIDELFSAPFDLLLGRRTYDIFAAYWPTFRVDPEADPLSVGAENIAAQFNRATKYVATHTPGTLKWNNSRSLGEDVPAAVHELKQGDGPDLLIQGSSQLVQTLLAHGLIDEIRLLIYPIVLGQGKRLFGSESLPTSFRLTRSATSKTGVLLTTYQPASRWTGAASHDGLR